MSSSDRSGYLSAGLVGAVIGALATFATGWFSYLNNKADNDAKMIELSVGILRAEATEETEPLREWAIDVIEKRAPFNFNEAQKAILLKHKLPYTGPSFSPASGPLGMP